MNRILVTGSRRWTHKARLYRVLENAVKSLGGYSEVIIVHGDCPTGADSLVEHWTLMHNVTSEKYQANWRQYGLAAGPIRNQLMVDNGADICLAFFTDTSKGTKHCADTAEKAGIRVVRIYE